MTIKGVFLFSLFVVFCLGIVSAINLSVTNLGGNNYGINVTDAVNLYGYEINFENGTSVSQTNAQFLGTTDVNAVYDLSSSNGIDSIFGAKIDGTPEGLSGNSVLFNISSTSVPVLRSATFIDNSSTVTQIAFIAPKSYANSTLLFCEGDSALYSFVVEPIINGTITASMSPNALTTPASPFVLSTSSFSATENTTISFASGTLTHEDVGNYSTNITVSDGNLSRVSVSNIRVLELNDAPIVVSITDRAVTAGDSLSLDVTASDEESANLTYNITQVGSDSSLLSVSGSGVVSGSFSTAGTYSYTLCSTDDGIVPDAEISVCGDDGNAESTCVNFSVVVSAVASSGTGGGSSGGGGGSGIVLNKIIELARNNLENGFSSSMREGDKFKFDFDDKKFYIELKDYDNGKARLNLRDDGLSRQVDFSIEVGGNRKVDLNKDGSYDFYFELSSSKDDKPEIYMKSISEEIGADNLDDQTSNANIGVSVERNPVRELTTRFILNVILIALILLLIVWIVVISIKRKKRK